MFDERIAVLMCFFLLFPGCFGSERDNLQDPVNTPILQIGDVRFDPSDGATVVSWSFIGQGAISEFRIQRMIDTVFEDIGSLPGPPGGRLERQFLTFHDGDPPAGERAFYRVAVPANSVPSALTEARSVVVPGMRLVSVTPNLDDGSIRVGWRGDADVIGIEVYRESGGDEERVFQTQDPGIRSFVDTGLKGDVVYRYRVRSLLEGAALDSRMGAASFFVSAGITELDAFSGTDEKSFLLTPKLTSRGSSLHVYHHGPAETRIRRYGIPNSGTSRTVSTFEDGSNREDREFVPSSLSVDFPGHPLAFLIDTPFGTFDTSISLFIGGISIQTGEVVLNANSANTSALIASSHRWGNEAGASRTSLSTDPLTGTIYFTVGSKLRVLDGDFVPAAEFDIPVEPSAIRIVKTTLWMAAPSPGRLLRGELTLDRGIPADIAWSEIELPDGADPVALSSNGMGQLFVLDAGSGRVLVTSPDGDPVFDWDLPNRPFDLGDIAVTSRNEAFVLDNRGTIHSYMP